MAKTTVKLKKITDYQPDPANPNQHTERGVSMLDDSLAAVGLGRSIVVDKNGIVLAGNSTQERAVDQGFEEALEVETDGKQLVVVKRTDLDLLSDDDKARKLTYYDNRTAQVGISWDINRVIADYNAEFDFSHIFNDNELNNFLYANEDFDPNQEWVGMPEFEQKDRRPFKQLIVNFRNESDIRAFAELLQQVITIDSKYIWYPVKPDEPPTQDWVSES